MPLTNMKKLTLIELIITILVLGLLVALAMPNLTGIKANADVEAFRKDIDTLEKVTLYSYVKDDTLPLGDAVTGLNESVMDSVYAFGGSDENLFRIDFSMADKYLQQLKNKETEIDFYVYSKDADKVFYTKGFKDSKGRIYHTLDYVGLKNLKINNEQLKNKMFVYETTGYMLEGQSIYGDKVNVRVNGETVNVNQTALVDSFGENIYASGETFDAKLPLVYGANKVQVGTEAYNSSFIVFVKNETDVNAPIAVIDMSPELGILVNMPITWDYSNSYSPNGANIVAAEWVGKEDLYDTPGEKTVQLRVKDSNDLWSDWTTKTFTVEDVTPVAVKDVKLTGFHAIALMGDGTVRVWGNGSSGRLGTGNTSSLSVPTKLESLQSVKQVGVMGGSTFALLENGDVYAWGANNLGQLGFGDTTNRLVPTKINTIANAKDLYVGNDYAFVRLYNNVVLGWGYNAKGQLGIDSVTAQNEPIQITSFTDVKEIYPGFSHVVFEKTDGTYWAVGDNSAGQLGINNTTNQDLPVQISGLSGVQKFVSGQNITFAIMQNGTVKSTGHNANGQLGVGDTTNRRVFTDVLNVSNVRDIETYANSVYFVTADDKLFSTGSHWYNISFGSSSNAPVTRGVTTVYDIFTSGNVTYSIESDGFYSWGATGPKAIFNIE